MLEAQRIVKHFGAVRALDGVSMRVDAGEVHGFVGPNGAGKTTAMRILMQLMASDAGDVRLDGALVTADVARGFGYMPEERGLYAKMRIADQLVYLARLHGLDAVTARERSAAWLTELGLADRARHELDKLSLGNQQRVQLAAALVHEPTVLVLDEPFSGLDPLAVDTLSEVLAARAAAGRHVLFSSHQLELVERLCRSVTIIVAGRVVASGEVERLRTEHGEPTWRVEVAGAPAGWWRAAPGVRPVGVDRYALAAGTDPQVVLRAALAAGRVLAFARVEPTLAEIFREVVAG